MLKRAVNKTLGLSYFQKLKFLRTSRLTQGREFTTGNGSCCKTEDEVAQKSSSDVKTEDKELVFKKKQVPYVIDEKDQPIVDDLKKGNIFYPYKDYKDRIYNIVKNDLKNFKQNMLYHLAWEEEYAGEVKYFPRYTDILIIGNGPIGLMTAYEIKSRFPYGPNVIVIDRNPNIPHETTNLGQGTLMQQLFTEQEEVEMTQYFVEFLSSFHRNTQVVGHPPFQVTYEPLGSLLLADETNAESLLEKSELMKKYRVNHRILGQELLRKKFPWLQLNGALHGSLGMDFEGVFDPNLFLIGLKCKTYNLGVNYVTAEVVDVAEENELPIRVICRLPDGTYNSINFCYLVIAAGMETTKIIDLLNNTNISPIKLELPLEERKRYEYCLYNPDGPGMNTPIVVDPDGTYFRREGLKGHYVVGVPSVPSNDDPKNGVYEVFNNKVKPFLMRRVPEFEKLEIVGGWADTYETNKGNGLGIIGPIPGCYRVLVANGFNQAGLQYVPAVGRAVMEYLLYDSYQTINFKRYEIENLYEKQHKEAEEKRRKLLESEGRFAITE